MPVEKLSVVIPVYNEELYVREVLEHVLTLHFPFALDLEVIVVDDGSTDQTRDILAQIPSHQALQIHYLEKNFGKGTAIREALKRVTGTIVIIQDADLEYSIADYPQLLDPILSGKASVVYGSRFLGKITGMRLVNRLFNYLIRFLVNILFHAHLTDEATAYKVFRTDVLRTLNLQSQRFEICPEITAKVLKRGIAIHEVPIRYRGRSHSQGKKIGWRDAVIALTTLLKYRWQS